jgi:hypothetical protein
VALLKTQIFWDVMLYPSMGGFKHLKAPCAFMFKGQAVQEAWIMKTQVLQFLTMSATAHPMAHHIPEDMYLQHNTSYIHRVQ